MSAGFTSAVWKGLPRKLAKDKFGKERASIFSARSMFAISFLLRHNVATFGTRPRKPRELLLKQNY